MLQRRNRVAKWLRRLHVGIFGLTFPLLAAYDQPPQQTPPPQMPVYAGSGWTTDTLKAHYDQLLTDIAHQLQTQNEKLDTSRVTVASRSEIGPQLQAMNEKLDAVKLQVASRDATNEGSTQTWALIAGGLILFCTVMGTIITVAGFIMVVRKKNLEEPSIRETLNRIEEKLNRATKANG